MARNVMIAAYVGYKIHGLAGAIAAACAIFLPTFIISLSVFAMLRRFRELLWMKAALRGLSAAIIGVVAVALLSMAPQAVPDLFTAFLFAIAVVLLLFSLAWMLLSSVTVGALVRAAAEHDAERPFSFGPAWRDLSGVRASGYRAPANDG